LWHDAYVAPAVPSPEHEAPQTSRVDIGVFANNGVHLSAPSFVSVSFPTHHERRYGPVENGEIRLLSVDYDAKSRDAFFDVASEFTADFADTFRYDETGGFLGWTRQRGSETYEFDAQGRLSDGRRVVHERAGKERKTSRVIFRLVDDE